MLRLSDWREFQTLDAVALQRSYTPTLAHLFASYFGGDTEFSALQVEVVSTYRELRRTGRSTDAARSAIRCELDRGAAHAIPLDNVYRFNAIHDELRFWIGRLCTDSSAEYQLT